MKKTVYKKLRIDAKRYSVEETASFLGISASYLYSIENGSREPGRDVLIRMKKLYQVPWEILMGEKEP